MSWELLPVNYTDAVWSGLKRYNTITNEDGTVSFQDVTAYSNKEKSFFGARDANRMNEALNTLMSMVENGSDLYEAFQNYFTTQKGLFENEADSKQDGFTAYITALEAEGDNVINSLKTDYRTEMDTFESQQQALFTTWFEFVKSQLGEDVAGNLQNQITALDTKTDGFDPRATTFSADGKTITEIDSAGNKKIETVFTSDTVITQKLYKKESNGSYSLVNTKTITFNADGLNITEEVV